MARYLQNMKAIILTKSLTTFSLAWIGLNQRFRNKEVMHLIAVREMSRFSLSLSRF